jgi:primary-amine oxidase
VVASSDSDQVQGLNPLATPDDCFEAEAIGKADEEVRRLLQERYGITDMSLVAFDPWSIHASPLQQRCIQLFTYMQSW